MNVNVKMRNVGLGVAATFGVYLLVTLVLGIYWSSEPDAFDPMVATAAYAKKVNQKPVVGYVSTVTGITLTERLLDKPGGFTANDIFPPGAWLDNMPAFEEGVVLQLRDFALVMRNDWSRSQSQSVEDEDLLVVQGQYAIDTDSWAFPSAEGEYDKGAQHLQNYLVRLTDTDATDAQFYARADNLAEWLALVQKRLVHSRSNSARVLARTSRTSISQVTPAHANPHHDRHNACRRRPGATATMCSSRPAASPTH